MTAAERIAAAVRSGDVTPAAPAVAALGAARAASHLNAFTLLDDEAPARAPARPDGPLAGVPVAIKDLIDQAGVPTTCGSSFYREVPGRSAVVVGRLEAAGAVIVGRTGLHEFAFGFSSENPWFGPVRNPLDPETSPGGSSGGSAAAVAAGIVPIALGTDTGGSVRVPAALCGIVGLKPTHGRVPLSGVFPLVASIDTVGPLARSVDDVALAYRVIAGHHAADPWSAPRPVEPPDAVADLAGLRIAVPHPLVDRPLGGDVASGFAGALRALAEAGAVVVHTSVPEADPPGLLADSIGPEVASVHRDWLARHPERYGEDVRARLAAAAAVGTDAFAAALAWRAGLRHGLERALADADVIVTPTTAVTSKRIGVDAVETEAGPESHRRALSWFTAPINHAGLPALALPLAAAGSPSPSLQVIGPAWSEARLLAIGRALERAGIAASGPLEEPP